MTPTCRGTGRSAATPRVGGRRRGRRRRSDASCRPAVRRPAVRRPAARRPPHARWRTFRDRGPERTAARRPRRGLAQVVDPGGATSTYGAVGYGAVCTSRSSTRATTPGPTPARAGRCRRAPGTARTHRAGGRGTARRRRRARCRARPRRGQAAAARLAARRRRPGRARRRDRAGRAVARHRGGRRVSGLRSDDGAAVRGERGVPPRPLDRAHPRCSAADRPREHLPAHRGDVHAVRRAAARGRPAHGAAVHRVGRRAARRALPILWVDAPRWLYVPAYVVLGWLAMFYLPRLRRGRRRRGARADRRRRCALHVRRLVYGSRRPDPCPRWFGFHEVFHTFTLARVRLPVRRRLARRRTRTDAAASVRASRLPRVRRRGPRRERGRPAPSRSRRSPSQSSAFSPTSLTHQASASERDRATPASTRVSSTCRSGCRSRVMTGTRQCGEQLAALTDLDAPGDLAAGAVLELAGDLDALVAGALAELLDPPGACSRLLGVGRAFGRGRRRRGGRRR